MHYPIKNCVFLKHPLGDVTQWFAENVKMYKDAMGWDGGHNGVDLVRPHGEHMYAVEDGVVVEVKDDPNGFGKHIRIFNKDVTREWTYGHCHFIGVKQGQEVRGGQFVATMGNTGFVVSGDTPYWVTGGNRYGGTHLHLGLRRIKRDPRGWSYPGSDIKVTVRNYGNGTNGAVDPVPYFFQSPKARVIYEAAVQKKSLLLYKLAELLEKINV